MMGYNPGFVHSMTLSVKAHYRFFSIPKGRGERQIVAPKIAIKVIQKWLSFHFQQKFQPAEMVFGFVPGRSHIDAAQRHVGASWICSVDIENFFPSIGATHLHDVFHFLGYRTTNSINLLTRLCSIKGVLVQGAPTSPVISNIVLRNLDQKLQKYGVSKNAVVTRYADDIVVSGKESPPKQIKEDLVRMVETDGWKVATQKTSFDVSPARLKVHGLLVHGDKVRLTKGYRNRIRAYKHLLDENKIREDDLNVIMGHIRYSDYIDRRADD